VNISVAIEQPTVAIKLAKVGESVSDYSKKYLDLDKLLSEMEASFLAARKVNVVTRVKGSMEAVRDEQKFSDSKFSAGDAAPSGQLKNADYLILPEVHRFVFYSKTDKVPNLQSKYFRRDYGALEINAQVVDTASGQITATFAVKDGFSTKERMVNQSGGVPSNKHFSDMAKAVSAQMVDQFLSLAFPVEIINIKGETVYLNRGQDGGLKEGDVLSVYTKGEALIDPHTGENLGTAEEFIGKIQIKKVNPKFTVGVMLPEIAEGQMSVGCIVRKP
jgi:hypothetical protein